MTHFQGDMNSSLTTILAISTGALSLVVIVLIVVCSVLICKNKRSSKITKKESNPLYNVGEDEHKGPQPTTDQTYDYMEQ